MKSSKRSKKILKDFGWIALLGLVASGCSTSSSPSLPVASNISPAVVANAVSGDIVSGIQWPDQNGNNVQGHGGNILQVGSTYYWFGEDKISENSSNAYFRNVPCYSSTDLIHWVWLSEALTRQASGDLGPNRIVERPKVLYNKSTGKYVMYMHIDTPGYGTGKVGIAYSSIINGPYIYQGSILPLGLQSWDMNLFQDTDGSAYLLTHASDNRLHIEKLSSDYLSVASSVAALTPDYEAPAILKANGRYYLFASQLTGWNTNDNYYTSATSLSGPWSGWSNFAPVGTDTWNSQTACILPIVGSGQTTYMFMGDRWNPTALGNSTFVWLPLQVSGTSLSLNWYGSWNLNVSTGAWSGNSTGIVSGQVCTLINRNSNEMLDNGNTTANASKVIQYPPNGNNTQQWKITATADGYYTLVSQMSGKALDNGNTTTNAAGVIQYTPNGNKTQNWKITSVGGGYYSLLDQMSGDALDNGNTGTVGAGVMQYKPNGNDTQKWFIAQ